EREARWRVWLLFGLLVGIMLVCVVVVAVAIGLLVATFGDGGTAGAAGSGRPLDVRPIVICVLVALALAVLYWFVARRDARDRLVRLMHARPLDPHDQYHQRLAAIVEEMRIATGAPVVECLTVPTPGMNAFTFSDLKGGACIGVTEGALSRLSRQQLECVVAHEFGHVLSGDYVTATTACLLFGVYSDIAEVLNEDLSGSGDPRAQGPGWSFLVWPAQGASAVVNAALSRQREWVADAAAARYTRDPVSLAQALFMMARHPGGNGYIPDGLAALCIAPIDPTPHGWIDRAVATHPPVNDRITRLLNVAHMGWDAFMAQNVEAEDRFGEREHVDVAPGAAAAVATAPLVATAAEAVAPVAQAVAAETAPSGLPAGEQTATARAAAGAPASGPSAAVAAAEPPGAAAAQQPLAGAPADSLRAREPSAHAVVCPACGGFLQSYDYEGSTIAICRSCGGRALTTDQVRRILTRRQMRFNDAQVRLADFIVSQGDRLRRDFARRRREHTESLIRCPRCERVMVRRHYSYEHAVEIDYCGICDLYWFDRDELEALQVIVERGLD
ncbi:MAG TPA: zinc metalloprotease HtpX, partial [Thermoleophilia bacterium]|nr:zinc metalloprotease HtpX [Thermoleophilia bacterium]